MILTVCIFVFSSLVSVDPVSEDCIRGNDKDLAEVSVMCRQIDRDPLATCELQRVGVAKYFVRIRRLELNAAPTPVSYPASAGDKV